MKIPANYKLQYSRAEIQAFNQRLAAEINLWIETIDSSKGQLVIVPILRGAIIFVADLIRELGSSVTLAPVRSWSYQTEDNSPAQDLNFDEMGFKVAGKSILLVDDICESGRTLQFITDNFMQAGAADVKSAVLINRYHQAPRFKPDFIGSLYAGSEWFVGYGMDDRDQFRNLPDIYVISNE